MPPIIRICLLAALVSLLVAPSANAQSFFEKLFGFGTSKKEPPAQLPPPMPSYRAPIHIPPPRTAPTSEEEFSPRISGNIRTVCVRMCDGYYFPISNSTNGRNLNADNSRCKATCGNDARLFYGESHDEPDVASMIDLSGRRYDSINTAFAYRKALRPGCACRPPPWSSSEQLRHFKYALEDAQKEMTAASANDIAADGKLKSTSQSPHKNADEVDVAAHQAAAVASSDSELAHEDQHVVQAQNVTAASAEKSGSPHQRQSQRGQRPQVTRALSQSARQHYRKAGSPTGLSSIFGFGQQQKYVWPGDAR